MERTVEVLAPEERDFRQATWVPTEAEIAEAVREIQSEWTPEQRRKRCRWTRNRWTVPEAKVSTTCQSDCPRGNTGLRRPRRKGVLQ